MIYIVLSFILTSGCWAQSSVASIDKKEMARMQPKIQKWLDFYKLDINKFGRPAPLTGQGDLPMVDTREVDTTSIYYRKFTEKDDLYLPRLHDYSPNKQQYINILSSAGVYLDTDNKLYYYGGDDCQEVYLTDRKKKEKYLILWMGSFERAEAAFWIDNRTFVIAGYTLTDPFRYIIHIFGYKGKYYEYLQYEIDERPERYYFEDVNLKERLVITE